MRLAFYAPLKPPSHPTPSGDRTVARGLLAALSHLGAEVDQPSNFTSREGKGDAAAQAALLAEAEAQIAQALAHPHAASWRYWLTYHNYYKAPDLIGPGVARALDIPYLIVEPSRARKRLSGPWARFAARAEAACDAADALFYLTERDAEALRVHAPAHQHLIHLHPFLPRADLPPPGTGDGPMLAVGMLRHAAKLPSYRIIAETLGLLPGDWQLEIAGDGPARAEVAALMAPFGSRVRMPGALTAEELAQRYATASLLFWPGVDEAFGQSYLEAQAHGLPVVAQNRPGVREVLAPGIYPDAEEGSAPLAARLAQLLAEPRLRQEAARAARTHVAAHHLLPAAAKTLERGLRKVGVA